MGIAGGNADQTGIRYDRGTRPIADTPDLPAPANPLTPPVAKASEAPADEAEEAEVRIPQSDPVLRESERILADYVAMLPRPASLAVAAP